MKRLIALCAVLVAALGLLATGTRRRERGRERGST